MTEQVVVSVQDGVMRIGIHRPEKKNALLAQMYAAMAEAISRGESDPAVKVMLIHGVPGAFTAGNDLKDFLERPPASKDAPVSRFLAAIRDARKPLIAAVSGVAVGIGTTMLLHCDLVYCTAGARFQLPFASLGLCPEAGSGLLLPALAGHQRAAELLLLGEPFGAEKAREIGLANAVCAEDELMDRAEAAARRIVSLPAAAIRATKALMKQGLAELVRRQMDDEMRVFAERLGSPEAREAFSAFLEKRAPDFSRYA